MYGAIGERSSSYGPVGKKNRVESLFDNFSPGYYDTDRVSNTTVAVFNLLSTIVGGGALSLPFAFRKCGWLLGTIAVLASIQISVFSLELLCLLARKLGCKSYSQIMQKTLGQRAEEVCDVLMFFMLFLVLIAFLILIKDIAGDICEYLLPGVDHLDGHSRSMILVVIAICMYPLMIADSLHALRHVSYVGSASVLLLLFVIGYKAAMTNLTHPELINTARMGPPLGAVSDVLTAVPIILIAFLCQFNVVEVYANLIEPSSQRISTVLSVTIYLAGFIYILFGLAGYLFAFDKTADNILNNFSSKDPSLVIARIGLVLTLMCQMPMVAVPCRKRLEIILNEHLGVWIAQGRARVRRARAAALEVQMTTSTSVSAAVAARPVLTNSQRVLNIINNSGPLYQESTAAEAAAAAAAAAAAESKSVANFKTQDDEMDMESTISDHSMEYNNNSGNNRCATNPPLLTFYIMALCLTLSEYVPGVSTIWAIAGSSISLVLAFFLPATAYLAFVKKHLDADAVHDWNYYAAYALLVLSVVMIVFCTTLSVQKLLVTSVEPA